MGETQGITQLDRLDTVSVPVPGATGIDGGSGTQPRAETPDPSRALVDNMLEGYARCRMIFDGATPVDWIYLEANAALERLSGLRDVVGKRVCELIPNVREIDGHAFVRYGEVVGTGIPARWEYHLSTLDMWIEVSAYRPAEGEFVALFHNITERKRAEAALLENDVRLRALAADLERRVEERTSELARASRAKDEFLAGMSHELRTPLNAILGIGELLSEGVYGPLEDRQRSALGRQRESGLHLLSLIDDILDIAKVGAGKLELSVGEVDVSNLCSASLQLVEAAAQRKKLSAELRVDGAVPTLVGDERRLRQVLVNLLNNAVKFTPERGAIGVDAGPTTDRAGLRITVHDTGVGIAPEDLARLFEPFVQLDSRLCRQHGGSGLGLALVRQLVALHGGTVTVESTVGVGSRFTVTLPLAPPSPR